MFSLIALLWVGFKLDAPLWYFVLIGFGLLIGILNIGIKLGKSSEK